jgi:hypothetical protein
MYYCCRPANFSEKTFFFFLRGKLPQEVKKKKEFFMKNLPGVSNNTSRRISLDLFLVHGLNHVIYHPNSTK